MEQPEQPELVPIIIDGPPWEKKHELGFFVAFVETIKAFLLRPGLTFSVMRRKAGIADALVYTVAIQVFTFLWTMSFYQTDPDMFFPPEFRDMVELPDNFSQIMVIAYPFSVIFLQFISAFAIHLSLKWRGMQTYDFSLVFRMVAYIAGTASLLIVLPIVGGILNLIVLVYLAYTGLRTLYGLDAGSFLITIIVSFFLGLGLLFSLSVGLTILALILSLIF